jgi:hypothetical protein
VVITRCAALGILGLLASLAQCWATGDLRPLITGVLVAAACSSWRSWHDLRVSPEHYPVMVDRALWLLTVILFSLIPALMYFQFDREKLRTSSTGGCTIFRLDPSMETVATSTPSTAAASRNTSPGRVPGRRAGGYIQ